MKKLSHILTILLSTLAISITPVDASATETIIQADQDQPLAATLAFAAPLKTMTEIPFELQLGENNGDDPTIHSAVCALTMPAMAMPDNQPDLSCGQNSCKGTAVFTMAGAWRATFGLVMKDGTHTSIDFDIAMVKMK